MSAGTVLNIRERVSHIETTPAIPAVMVPLMKVLNQPSEEVDIDEVVRLVSYDNSIAAQCMRMANSPLFGLSQQPKSVSAAVVALGLHRVESILLTCCMGNAFPVKNWALDPLTFWRHSLGCAMVCRKFSEQIGSKDSEKAYVAGLLHDIGILANCIAFPGEFACALGRAHEEQLPLDDAEVATMGFSHCETGQALAEQWKLADEIIQVVAHHHDVARATSSRSLVALVHLGDLLCRMRDLGYGYYERTKVDMISDPAWAILKEENRGLDRLDIARFTFELDGAVGEISDLVSMILGPPGSA
jgi:putative nucleotidyltransferase with HDIG domain